MKVGCGTCKNQREEVRVLSLCKVRIRTFMFIKTGKTSQRLGQRQTLRHVLCHISFHSFPPIMLFQILVHLITSRMDGKYRIL